jgi:prepilin-type N-terminal cleavage/methylation domain-containing protein
MKRSSRGFSLVEMLAGVVIIGLIVMASLAIFFDRQRRLRMANETVLAWQALANEAEIERRLAFDSLDPSKTSSFLSDAKIAAPLANATTIVSVQQTSADVKLVTLSLRWNNGARNASLTLVRVNTGGSPLW